MDTATISLPKLKSLGTSSGYKYTYVYEQAKGSKPTFMLLHGFPSSMYDWRFQIASLIKKGYGILAPDLLGYGGTDKPKAVEEYAFSKISKAVGEILKREGLEKVIGVGHDWGSSLLGKYANFEPEKFSSLVFVSVPYTPGAFDLDGINAQTEAAFGYPVFGYMKFFNESGSAPLCEKNLESLLSLIYPPDSAIHKEHLCPYGAAEAFISSNTKLPLPAWEKPFDRAYRQALFKTGGLTGPLNWYKAQIRDVDAEAVAAIPPQNVVLTQPVLFIGGSEDYVTRPEVMQMIAGQGKAEGWLPTVETKIVEGGSHWVVIEKHDEVTDLLVEVAGALEK